MNITITINLLNYPKLINIKESLLENIIFDLINTGYNIHYPSNEIILNNINDNQNNYNLSNKIELLEESLNKLIGLSTNSNKKGNIAECILEDIITNRYSDIIYEKKNHIPHSGDGWIYLSNNKIIMIESKNYNSTINKDEIEKLQNDMIFNNIKWAVMISFNSNIQGMKELDIHSFNNNNQLYFIIMISNLISDIHKLDLGLQIIKTLIINFDKPNKFPWITDNIKKNLFELNNIIENQSIIRENYYNMEKDINKILSNFYISLRNYQYEIDKKINELIKNINNTMDNAIDINNVYNNIINKYSNKKIFYIINRIIDFSRNNKWYLSEISDKEYDINNNFGKIKIYNN
jgi:hypothetical protein